MHPTNTHLLLTGLLAAAACSSSHAALFFYESFEGSNWVSGNSAVGVTGNSSGAIGQSGAWGLNPGTGASITVTTANTTPLSYSNGTISINGDSKYLAVAATASSQGLEFGVNLADVGLRTTSPFNGFNPAGVQAAGGSVFFSALVRINAGSLAGDQFQFGVVPSTIGGGGSFTGVGIGGNTTLATQITRNGGLTGQNTASAAAIGSTYLVVGRLGSDGTNFTSVDLWLNPASSTDAGTPTQTVSGTSFSLSQVGFVMRATSFDSGDSVAIDEIRMGTSWGSVVAPIPEPSAFAALAGVGALGCAALRRRRRG